MIHSKSYQFATLVMHFNIISDSAFTKINTLEGTDSTSKICKYSLEKMPLFLTVFQKERILLFFKVERRVKNMLVAKFLTLILGSIFLT